MTDSGRIRGYWRYYQLYDWLQFWSVCAPCTSGLTEGSAQVGPDPREEGLRKEMEREKAKWGLVYAFLCVINQPILCCERACRSIILSSHSTWRWSLLLHMTIQVPILKYGLASFSGNFLALWIIYSHGESMGIILLWFCTHYSVCRIYMWKVVTQRVLSETNNGWHVVSDQSCTTPTLFTVSSSCMASCVV